MIIPVGPPLMDYSISGDQAHRLMKKAPGSLMVRYTYVPKETSGCEDWYAVICDNFKDLDALGRNYRYQIKRGLTNCSIRQVDAGFIAKCGYEVYNSAFSRYQGLIKPIGIDDFRNMINATIDFDDLYHYWGAFYNDRLIAYAVMVIYGDEAADMSVLKFHPEYLRYYVSDALIYTICKHYLQNNPLQYINDGFRSIYHKTNFQQFLIRKFLFKKAYLGLGVTYKSFFYCLLKATYPLRNLLSKANNDLKAIYLLEEIRKKV
jgi:hypothetical protein